MALFKKYTLYESRQMRELSYHYTHHKKQNIKDIDKISEDMLHTVYYDKNMRSVYDKKKITVGALQYMFANTKSNKVNHENQRAIQAHDPQINQIVCRETSRQLVEKEKRKYCTRCSESCVIL